MQIDLQNLLTTFSFGMDSIAFEFNGGFGDEEGRLDHMYVEIMRA